MTNEDRMMIIIMNMVLMMMMKEDGENSYEAEEQLEAKTVRELFHFIAACSKGPGHGQ